MKLALNEWKGIVIVNNIHEALVEAIEDIEAFMESSGIDSFWAELIKSTMNEALILAMNYGVGRGAYLATIKGTTIQ